METNGNTEYWNYLKPINITEIIGLIRFYIKFSKLLNRRIVIVPTSERQLYKLKLFFTSIGEKFINNYEIEEVVRKKCKLIKTVCFEEERTIVDGACRDITTTKKIISENINIWFLDLNYRNIFGNIKHEVFREFSDNKNNLIAIITLYDKEFLPKYFDYKKYKILYY